MLCVRVQVERAELRGFKIVRAASDEQKDRECEQDQEAPSFWNYILSFSAFLQGAVTTEAAKQKGVFRLGGKLAHTLPSFYAFLG